MRRQNFGPERFDVDAKMDLATHDVSILFYLFDKELEHVQWADYNRGQPGKQNDSSLGLLTFSDFKAIINVSWHHSKKDRICFFDFENGCIEWDDTKKSLNIEAESDIIIPEEKSESPLQNSILSFLEDSEYSYQEELTIKTIGAVQ